MEEDTEHIARLIESIERREEMGRECLEHIAKRYLDALERIALDTNAEFGEWATAYMNLKYVALCAIQDGYNIREHFLNRMRAE